MSIGKKNIDFSLIIVGLYIKSFLDHILNNSEFLTVCVTFFKPPCYINLWQFFMFCCSFNGVEWFFIFFNKIPFLRSLCIYTYIAYSVFITFRTNVRMSIIPPHIHFCFAFQLEWSLNRGIDKNQIQFVYLQTCALL